MRHACSIVGVETEEKNENVDTLFLKLRIKLFELETNAERALTERMQCDFDFSGVRVHGVYTPKEEERERESLTLLDLLSSKEFEKNDIEFDSLWQSSVYSSFFHPLHSFAGLSL